FGTFVRTPNQPWRLGFRGTAAVNVTATNKWPSLTPVSTIDASSRILPGPLILYSSLNYALPVVYQRMPSLATIHHVAAAMAAAANFAFANRQLITHWVRQSFEQVFKVGPRDLGMELIYDVAHNIAKIETHEVGGGVRKKLCIHRKGATRAFPPHHPETPAAYQETGQPVLIPGDMGRYSFVLVGTEKALTETFGSTCHGAGREMSRHQALKVARGRSIVRELKDRGIVVRGAGRATIDEEISEAYKDVAMVVDVCQGAGISKKVAKLKPLGVIKG
ncbi:MAG: RtcB family protein, partial [Desulfobaccales bacterium]